MPKVTYILSDGSSHTIEASEGESVRSIAIAAGLDGIVGRCGGYCNCGTCHVYVDDAWLDKLPEQSPEEDEMLEGTFTERTASSRLSCQIPLTSALDGIVVSVPEIQE